MPSVLSIGLRPRAIRKTTSTVFHNTDLPSGEKHLLQKLYYRPAKGSKISPRLSSKGYLSFTVYVDVCAENLRGSDL